MSEYGGSNYSMAKSYHHGYGPRSISKQELSRSEEKAPAYTVGESASYDNVPNPGDSRTLFDHKSELPNDGFSPAKPKHAYGERGIADFFYKQPDPSYSGMYGTDYQPQISKTKVAIAAASVATVFYGLTQYKKRKENQKKYEKYTRSNRSHRSKKSSASSVGRQDSFDGRSKY
ncbi:hypothetical protein IWW36_003345 [Coemansia brasiliensis]|uniref:Uncharacterized protein n=1 Tax=Coemansia brasiliensis TaxID=2650707 RepID=A0A9W8LXB1_9FUNG|nr:hypothetical protein IWW36_003345 [Coemansia brasiliensis]